jgi:hypothetical protein
MTHSIHVLSDDDGQAVYDLPFVSRGILLRKCLCTTPITLVNTICICIFTNKKMKKILSLFIFSISVYANRDAVIAVDGFSPITPVSRIS